jgi:hypothetical protein
MLPNSSRFLYQALVAHQHHEEIMPRARQTSNPPVPGAKEVENVVSRFYGWSRWADRFNILLPGATGTWKAHEYPGVYLFAEFGTAPPHVSSTDDAIFYVGETGRTLAQRWGEYEGWIRGVWNKDPEHVFVAAFPTWIGRDNKSTPEPLTKQFRLYTERRIIWEHVRTGHLLLNTR